MSSEFFHDHYSLYYICIYPLYGFLNIHYREISTSEPVFQKGLPFLVTLIETDVHVGSQIIHWGWKTNFFHYPKSYPSWNLIGKKKIMHKLKRVFPKPSEVNG